MPGTADVYSIVDESETNSVSRGVLTTLIRTAHTCALCSRRY